MVSDMTEEALIYCDFCKSELCYIKFNFTDNPNYIKCPECKKEPIMDEGEIFCIRCHGSAS